MTATMGSVNWLESKHGYCFLEASFTKREGKVIYIKRMTVSSDGRTMTFEVHDLLFGQERKSEATKQ